MNKMLLPGKLMVEYLVSAEAPATPPQTLPHVHPFRCLSISRYVHSQLPILYRILPILVLYIIYTNIIYIKRTNFTYRFKIYRKETFGTLITTLSEKDEFGPN